MDDALMLAVDSISKVGLALHQNGVPIIRSISVTNRGAETRRDIRAVVTSDPAFFTPLSIMVAGIPPGDTVDLKGISLCLSHTFLSSTTERVVGAIKVSLFESGVEAPVAEIAKPMDICAHDEWFGAEFLPELLAAFVTPNSDEVAKLLQRVSALMQERGGSSALDGYQRGDKTHVLLMVKCIYDAVLESSINYAEPPASFGRSGQRIRFADQITAHGFATCLDFSLLFAGMMEQCGLNPLVMICKGHAYVGCHLLNYRFPDAIIDDLQTLRKRAELDEIACLETTVAAGSQSKFSVSLAAGSKHLADDDAFLYGLDVAQARAIGIRPLSGVAGLHEPAPFRKSKDVNTEEALPDLHVPVSRRASQESGNVPARVVRWRSKLLDLSRRNRLLNFKDSKQAVSIVFFKLAELEDGLSSGSEFSVNPQPAVFAQPDSDPRSLSQLERQTGENPVVQYIAGEFEKNRLRSYLEEKELERRLTGLHRQTRTDIEDGGVNTLFLATGFLRWVDGSGSGSVSYLAPLLLLPVRLERQSACSGYTLKRTDEDAVVNVTLLEMLRRDFGRSIAGLEPPPQDDNGLDVAAVFRLFREAILDLKGWEVVEELWLGRLFFSKFIMWDDMNRRLSDLCACPIVGHLIKGGGVFDDGVVAVQPNEVDACIKPEDLFCPMSADSSQLAAVISAARGKNFVLHGPPGTGKSQTITNLIAHGLAVGKTVLFVAEKRAALEVVQRRLSKIGLAPFCLELHSNKAGKTEVLKQFSEALAFGNAAEPRTWTAAAHELEATRNALSGYVAALHKSYPCGLTPFHAFSCLFAHSEEEELVKGVGPLTGATLSENETTAMLEAGRELAAQANEIPAQLFDAFALVRPIEWSPGWERDAVAAATAMRDAAADLNKRLVALGEIAGIENPESLSFENLDGASQLAKLLVSAPALPPSFFNVDWRVFSESVRKVSAVGETCKAIAAKLAAFDMDDVAVFNVAEMRTRLDANEERFIITRMLRNGKARKEIAACMRPESRRGIKKSEIPALLEDFEIYARNRKAVESVPADVSSRMRGLGTGLSTDWAKLAALVSFCDSLYAAAEQVSGGRVGALPQLCARLGASASASERADQSESMRGFSTAHEKLVQVFERFRTALFIEDAVQAEAEGFVPVLAHVAESVLRHAQHLRRWCIWNQTRAKCLQLNMGPVVAAVESGDLECENVPLAIRKRYFERFISDVIDKVPELRNFLGNSQNGLVEKFSQIDAEIEQLAQKVIVARLAQRLPSGRMIDCPSTSELGILKRECEKKARHKPVRTLLEAIPTILPVLKPCMLMSPLSVAQYLPPGSNNFDIIVFDEASQITVWDAIGAMARGKQVVIVGDPKQLPPTTFFQRQAEEGEVDDSDIEEMESILDECKAAGVSDLHLLWHYRSRHESLIAFSNHNYYGDSLLTFPSAVRESKNLGVSFVWVEDAVYDKSKTRTNRKEAETLVAAVVARLRDPAMAGKSTGVVTFSQAQQTLIEDLIDEERRKYPEIEKFFAEDNQEPFFVKNLENVQGDERDAIYFSICYGKDKDGNFAMNFGPLNRPGGERRLNVAVTRAKEQVVVFSSINATQIDTGRTQAMGAVQLKEFLEYAERGNSQVIRRKAHDGDLEAHLFENEVASFLLCHGYVVDRQVGCSGYRIEIAVRSRDDDGRYVMGVECDGEQYHESDSARDRDKLRRIVLEGLGWRLVRVWCASWWFDREQAERALLDEVDAAMNGLPPPTAGTRQFKSFAVVQEMESTPSFTVEGPNNFEMTYAPGEFIGDYAKSQSNFNVHFGPQIIGEQMKRIVNAEGPIVESLLRYRVIREWGFTRTGSTMADVLDRSVPKMLVATRQFGERVFWPEGVKPEDYQYYRKPGTTEEPRRAINEIPVVEIKNAMAFLVTRFHSIPQEALYTETAKLFGFIRIAPSARQYYDEALKLMKNSQVRKEGS